MHILTMLMSLLWITAFDSFKILIVVVHDNDIYHLLILHGLNTLLWALVWVED